MSRWPIVVCSLTFLSTCGVATPATQTSPIEEATSTSAAQVTSTVPVSTPGRLVEVPSAFRPVIDGALASGEWDDAFEASMTDGGSVYSMHDGQTLFVAIDNGEIGAVNVALATAGEIWILHSSAALGSARYVAGDLAWQLAHGFSWCCRSSIDDTDRRSLLEKERWQATIGFEGDDGFVEFEVDLPWDGARLAVSFVDEHGVQAFWPTDLSPAAREQLVGTRESDVDFRMEEWSVVTPLGN